MHRFVLIGTVLAFLVGVSDTVAVPQQRTSENDPGLARGLQRFPEADADKDGILTQAEARAYRKANRRAFAARANRALKQNAPAPTVVDAKYGPHDRNVLDLFKADSESATPVLIFFHGGGFVSGDKRRGLQNPLYKQCLAEGISFVAANYRFVRGPQSAPFPAPMLDGARVVQFVRSKAEQWNIDPERVALTGGSAGACMALWIALQDDIADPEHEDPLGRISTKVTCVIGRAGPTTLDPEEILKHIGGRPSVHPSLLPFYGVESIDDLKTPEMQEVVHSASVIHHVTQDDPPLQLRHAGTLKDVPLPPDASTGKSIHHPMFGKLLKDRYDAAGLQCELVCSDLPEKRTEIEFLKACFGM